MSFEISDPNNPTFGEMSVTIYPQFVPYEKPYSLREFVAAKGLANGIASLGSDGKIPSTQLPSAIASGMSFVGQWNASTNTPNLLTATPRNGDYYRVSVSGATALSGESDWKQGDWAVYLDSTNGWAKIDNSELVTSVAGRTGAVALNFTDLAGSATAAQHGAASVLTAAIADLNVTEGKLADSSVTVAKLGALAVTTAKLADLNVTTDKIAASAVDSSKMAANSVLEAAIAASAVTNLKIAAGTIAYDRLASDAVRDSNIAATSISAGKLAGAIPYSKLTLNAGEVPADRIGTIPGTQITTNTLTGTQILDGSIATSELADLAVTDAKLAAGSVVASKIAAEQVTSVKLAKRTMKTTCYPNFPNSSLRVEDPNTSSLGFSHATYLPSKPATWCSYLFTTTSATAKSGYIGMRFALPYNYVSLDNLYIQVESTGATSQVFLRLYDSNGDLRNTTGPIANTFGAMSVTTIASSAWPSASFSSGTFSIEIELKGVAGDVVKINSLAYDMTVQ